MERELEADAIMRDLMSRPAYLAVQFPFGKEDALDIFLKNVEVLANDEDLLTGQGYGLDASGNQQCLLLACQMNACPGPMAVHLIRLAHLAGGQVIRMGDKIKRTVQEVEKEFEPYMQDPEVQTILLDSTDPESPITTVISHIEEAQE